MSQRPSSTSSGPSPRAAGARRWRRLVPLCLLLTACDDGLLDPLTEILSILGLNVPGLTQDAGPGPTNPLTPGQFDAAGFFDDAGVVLAAEGESCLEHDCAAGNDCVVVSALDSRCLRRCEGGCASSQRCETLAAGDYCLGVVGRGARCETSACAPDGGVRCLPARVEANAVLAYTCQVPCAVGDDDACPAGETCVPDTAGELELQGGTGLACDPAACAAPSDGGLDGGVDAGACPCTAPFGCVTTEGGAVCARPTGLCGMPVGPGDPRLLDDPSRWPDGGTCDPGVGQRYCMPDEATGAPVYCYQGAAGELPGLCVAICLDPTTGATHDCPAGFTCAGDAELLFHVANPEAACDDPGDCNAAADEQCVGPLPAFNMERRCGVAYGVCVPEP